MSILLAVAMLLGCTMAFSACGETANVAENMVLNVGSKPDTIDPALNSAVDGATYIVPWHQVAKVLEFQLQHQSFQ